MRAGAPLGGEEARTLPEPSQVRSGAEAVRGSNRAGSALSGPGPASTTAVKGERGGSGVSGGCCPPSQLTEAQGEADRGAQRPQQQRLRGGVLLQPPPASPSPAVLHPRPNPSGRASVPSGSA